MHNSINQFIAEQQNGFKAFPARFQPRYISLGAAFL
jgi:hypothetical protein